MHGYRSHFLPFESQNEEKNEEHKAVKFFRELRFIPFGDKREKYMSQVLIVLIPSLDQECPSSPLPSPPLVPPYAHLSTWLCSGEAFSPPKWRQRWLNSQ